MNRAYDDAIRACDSEYGTLVREYPEKPGQQSASKQYEKKNVKLPDEEQKEWYGLWNNVVKAKFAEWRKVSRADFEFDKNQGVITLWVKANSSEKKMGAIGAKEFFKPIFYGTQVTNVYYKEKPKRVKIRYNPDADKIKFEFLARKV